MKEDNNIKRYNYETFIPSYNISVFFMDTRTDAERIINTEKKTLKVHWGTEYWMRHAEAFEKDKGICRIPLEHIPQTVIVNEDGTYDYSTTRTEERREYGRHEHSRYDGPSRPRN